MAISVLDRKSTRLNSSHVEISYAVFCLKKKNNYLQAYAAHFNLPVQTGVTVDRRSRRRVAVTGRGCLGETLATYPSSSTAFFFFNDTATTEIYTLSLHDALPI